MIYIFGELFGGYYNEDDKKFKPIQTEVKYSQKPLFYMFDVFIDGKPIDFEIIINLADKIKFPMVPILHVKKFGEIIDWENQTTLFEYKDF